jgi:hypothetical protein
MQRSAHNVVTLKNGKDDANSILQVLNEIAAGRLKNDVRLLNYYHEVPVSYDANIAAIEQDSVELSVHEHQALVIKHDHSTLLKSSHFPNELGVHCYAAYINVAKKTAILHNFAYAQIRAERREAVRVKVGSPIPLSFLSESADIDGNILDISGTGISLTCPTPPAVEPGTPGQLLFRVENNQMDVSGELVRVIEHGENGCVCIFQMTPDRRSDNIIGQFIYKRQIEIIQELKAGILD